MVYYSDIKNKNNSFLNAEHFPKKEIVLHEIVVITSYPPRECGIATYSQDLVFALQNKFTDSFQIKICALEAAADSYAYSKEVQYILKTDLSQSYTDFAEICSRSADSGYLYFTLIHSPQIPKRGLTIKISPIGGGGL